MLLIDKLLVKELIDVLDRLTHLGQHRLELRFQLRHDELFHSALELVLHDLLDRLVRYLCSRAYSGSLGACRALTRRFRRGLQG